MAGPTDTTRTQRARARPHLLQALQAAGTLPCPRCPHPIYPWQDVDVGHTTDVRDGGADSPMRLEHTACNRRAGDRRRTHTTTPPPPHINSRDW
jgi:hypothetical protein